jgi:4-diphosphocytidyl-2-C-methyl-D-erythritol kinase
VKELAPAKVNLCLYLGPRRPDGYHDLVSVIQSLELADSLELCDHESAEDEVRCPGVAGPEPRSGRDRGLPRDHRLGRPAAAARDHQADPVAAGLGGGSADAQPRCACSGDALASAPKPSCTAIATALGADVPSQLRPGRWLAEGIGERLTPLPEARTTRHPDPALTQRALDRPSTRSRPPRPRPQRRRAEAVRDALDPTSPEPVNDLERAARSLEPTIDGAIERALGEGATH